MTSLKLILNEALAGPAGGRIRLGAIAIVLLLAFLPFAPSFGKIFSLGQAPKGPAVFDTTANWRRIYKALMTINGARADLSIYGCDEPLETVTIRLKQSFSPSKANQFIANENSAWMLSAAGNRVLRALAVAMSADKSLVFVLAQSPAEFAKSVTASSAGISPDHSLFPEGRLETIIKNEETGATLETRITAAPQDVVINEISEKLSRDGWKPLSATGHAAGKRSASQQCFLMFQRSAALCAVMVAPALCENKTCVTILTKETKRQ